MKKLITFIVTVLIGLNSYCQNPDAPAKLYDETVNPIEQIDAAVLEASQAGKFVVCQVGGNWCPWCLRFAQFITTDEEISKLVSDNYVYVHVNYPRRNAAAELMQKLGNPGRFGFPAMVVLDDKGNVIHIQDSSYLEEGKGYDKEKVIRFFSNWTPSAVKAIR